MKHFFDKNFQIQPQEFQRVQAFFLFLTTISIFYTMGASIGDTLFLSHFGSAEAHRLLPWVYIGVGLVTVMATWFYNSFEHRSSRASTIMWSQIILALSIIVFRQLIALNSRWIYYALVIWLEACALVCLMLFFSFAGDYFTGREARRLYTYINGGVAIGSILGGYAVDAAVKWFKTEDLLYGCAGILVCGALGTVIIRRIAVPIDEESPEKIQKKAPLTAIFSNRYLQLIFIMVITAQLFSYLVDYQFKVVARGAMSDASLAAFFGRFYGLLGLAQLAVQFLFVGWLLKAAGIVHSLLLLPCLLVLGNFGFLIHPALMTAVIVNFTRLTLLETLDEPAQELLFIPLAQRMRIRVQSLVEGGLLPLGICLSGVVLLALSRLSIPMRQEAALGIIFGCAWILSIVFLLAQYRQTLAASLIKRQINPTDIHTLLDNKDSMAVLSDLLKSGDPKTVIPVLEMLRGRRTGVLVEEIESLLGSDDEAIAMTALQLLGYDRRRSSLSKVRRMVYDVRPAVRSAAVLASCQIQGEDIVPKAVQWMSVPDAAVRRAALLGVARYGGFDGNLIANKHLIAILENPDQEDRVEAIRLLGQVGGQGATWIVRRFLDDPDPVLKKEAILAIGRLHDSESAAKLIELLNNVHARSFAAEALAVMPPIIRDELSQRVKQSSLPAGARVSLARLLGNLGGKRAAESLWELIDPKEDLLLRVAAGQALHRLRMKDGSNEMTLRDLDSRLEHLCRDAALIIEAQHAVRQQDSLSADLFADYFHLQKVLILSLLAIRYDPRQFHRIQTRLTGNDKALRSNAIELLDVSLPRPLAGLIVPLLDPHTSDITTGPAVLTDELVDRLRQTDSWVRAILHFYFLKGGKPSTLPGDSIMEEQEDKLYQVFTTVTLLKQVDLFRRVPANYLATLAELVEQRNLYTGEVLFSEGDAADALYFICEGQVSIETGGREIARLGPGQVIGEMALLDSQPRSATCVAALDTRLIRISSENFNDLLSTQPEIAKGLLQTLAQRLREARDKNKP